MHTRAEPSQAIAKTLSQLVDLLHPERGASALETLNQWNCSDTLAAQIISRVHGIAPLLHRTVVSPSGSEAGSVFAEHLAKQYRIHQSRAEAMLDLCGYFEQQCRLYGDPGHFLKGCYLLRNGFYSEPALRPMADIDILLSRPVFSHMRPHLERLGLGIYSETPHSVTLLDRAHLKQMEDASLGMYVRPARKELYRGECDDSPIAIDVHFDVTIPLRFEVVNLSERLTAGQDGQLSLADLAIHLLLHNAQNVIDHRLRLVQLYDLALLLPKLTAEEWSSVQAFVERHSVERLARSILQLAEAVFGHFVLPGAARRFIQRASAIGPDPHTFIYRYSLCNPHPIRLRDQLTLCDSFSQRRTLLAYSLNGRHAHRTPRHFGADVTYTPAKQSPLHRIRRYLSPQSSRAGFRGFELHGFSADQGVRLRSDGIFRGKAPLRWRGPFRFSPNGTGNRSSGG